MASKVLNTTVVFLLLVVIAVVTTVVLLYVRLRTDEIRTAAADGEIIRTLIVAEEDERPFLAFLLFYHPETHRAAILDIPGSVGGVLRPLGRVDRLDAVFASDDVSAFRREIEALTGIPVSVSLVFSQSQLIDFVDLLGGMELFIIDDYRESEESGAPLPVGNVHLDGRKAIDYLRMDRRFDSDLEATARRQSFVQALLREIRRNTDLLVHAEVVPIRDRLIVTDADRRAVTSLFALLGDVEADRLVRRRVQGTIRSVEVDGATQRLLFPHFEGQWLKQSVQQIEQSLASAEDELLDQVVVSIEVLNGTLTGGLARRTSELLENYGFEVQRFGNAENDRIERTIVVDRRGVGDLAQRVAQVIRARSVVTEVTPDSDVDVTLILGSDFDGTVVRPAN